MPDLPSPTAGNKDQGGRPRLLMLCHRIPYPPDKGDKIRAWRWLKAVAGEYRVSLAAFVDDPADFVHLPRLEALCDQVRLLPLHPLLGRLRSLPGFLSGAPLSVRYYRDRRLGRWLAAEHRREPFARVFVYSSAVAQYVCGREWDGVRRVIDFVDVDADKWRQYAARQVGPMAWVYQREARTLLAHDLRLASVFDLGLFVTTAEVALFRRLAGVSGVSAGTLQAVGNGVDAGYFAPESGHPPPFDQGRPALVFTGAMDYWANVDAVRWFVAEAWPRVQSIVPKALFCIVGARPVAAVQALAGPDVLVTGRVPDVRPYLQHAAVVVAPMRIARGLQNKVLEGMAMARPVVTTSAGCEGLGHRALAALLVADDAAGFADRVLAALAGGHAGLGPSARQAVLAEHNWDRMTDRFRASLAGDAAPAALGC